MDLIRARLGDLSRDLKSIKAQLVDLHGQLTVYNHILEEHTKRSTNLEARMKPIEEWYVGLTKLYILLTALGAFVGLGLGIYKALH